MSIEIKDSRLNSGTLVARETGFQPGRNGNFDLSLFCDSSGAYNLEVFLKVQFFFVDGDEDKSGWSKLDPPEWTACERKLFITTWHKTIKDRWSSSSGGKLSDGGKLTVFVNFHIQEGGWMWDHFEIDVVKIPKAGFETSSVQRKVFSADVNLDSEDLTPKASGQLAAVHEFGHMIGMPDEYHTSSPHHSEADSIMHGGTKVKERHFTHLASWANKRIKK